MNGIILTVGGVGIMAIAWRGSLRRRKSDVRAPEARRETIPYYKVTVEMRDINGVPLGTMHYEGIGTPPFPPGPEPSFRCGDIVLGVTVWAGKYSLTHGGV